jgi:hypothetical protein
MRLLTALLFITIVTNTTFAQVPPSINGLFKKKVFVDFKKVHYLIEIDLQKKIVKTKTKIQLEQFEPGQIIFDLKKPCLKLLVNGKRTKAKTFFIPSSFGFAKKVALKTLPGIHEVEIETRLKKGVSFKGGIELGFWIRDLFGRRFLEQYLPTNFEFDQYTANLEIKFINGDHFPYELIANGDINKTKDGYIVKFPSFYTASSFFIHLFKRNDFFIDYDKFIRADGKEIEFITYSKDTSFTRQLKTKAIESLKDLESFYGSWPHDYLIIFGDQDAGGMEHAGATQTSLGSLDHELHHSYIGKAVIPNNGNSGWMDEAIVTWRDRNYPLNPAMKDRKENLACHSIYKRATDWDSYEKGALFIGHLAFLFNEKKINFNKVLKLYYETYKFQVVSTKVFRNFLEHHYGESLKDKFMKHTCGNKDKGLI